MIFQTFTTVSFADLPRCLENAWDLVLWNDTQQVAIISHLGCCALDDTGLPVGMNEKVTGGPIDQTQPDIPQPPMRPTV